MSTQSRKSLLRFLLIVCLFPFLCVSFGIYSIVAYGISDAFPVAIGACLLGILWTLFLSKSGKDKGVKI